MRIPKPHWKESHKCWYVKLKGKFHRLDADRERAFDLYRDMISRFSLREGLTPDSNLTVRELLDLFLDWAVKHNTPQTANWYRKHIVGTEGVTRTKSGDEASHFALGGFANSVGPRLLVRDLKPYHLKNWVDTRYGDASGNTKAGAITAVKRAFNWASADSKDGMGYIDTNPLRSVGKPSRDGRGEVAYLLPEQWQQVVDEVKTGREMEAQTFLDYITVMRLTGCRPQEMRKVEARHLDLERQRFVFPKEENPKARYKERRIIPLSHPSALLICRRLAMLYPSGPLFRNMDGLPWTNFAIACRFTRLTKKLGFKVIAYSIRHTFASDAIISGVDLITIAQIMGHKDLTMLNKIYQHIKKDQQHMQTAIMKATERAAM